ncbi:MAG: DUF262 domain-containing protein [Bdellovibrionaceae bacterium]|nr:DUF262 domain-containing protein [Pseudobdellovibrionaceae bacterium]
MAKATLKKKTVDSVEKAETIAFFQEDTNEQPPSDVIAYNELRSCADLYRMFTSGRLQIKPDFQRDIVWSSPQQSRFVDSLIKQLPIPSLCFSLDHESQKWLVIDGLQRISTIIKFLSKEEWSISGIEDIDPEIAGRSNLEIKKDSSVLYSRLENLTIPITVLRCDLRKKSHSNYLFTIFHRLNTGGMRLNNQEIRNAIFNGPLNELLKECNKYEPWRILMSIKSDKTYRYKREELILRFFAFYNNSDQYNGKLANFLNEFMRDHKNLSELKRKQWKGLFVRSIDCISNAGLVKLNSEPNAVVEALLYGIAKNIDHVEELAPSKFKKQYVSLKAFSEFQDENLRNDLSNRIKLLRRLTVAETLFEN